MKEIKKNKEKKNREIFGIFEVSLGIFSKRPREGRTVGGGSCHRKLSPDPAAIFPRTNTNGDAQIWWAGVAKRGGGGQNLTRRPPTENGFRPPHLGTFPPPPGGILGYFQGVQNFGPTGILGVFLFVEATSELSSSSRSGALSTRMARRKPFFETL